MAVLNLYSAKSLSPLRLYLSAAAKTLAWHVSEVSSSAAGNSGGPGYSLVIYLVLAISKFLSIEECYVVVSLIEVLYHPRDEGWFVSAILNIAAQRDGVFETFLESYAALVFAGSREELATRADDSFVYEECPVAAFDSKIGVFGVLIESTNE